ncbi:hypothetical protein QBZ16_002080 [Prototheca wickerhamii]|uniref:RRM domain-containing protein n=1 Tax=Prototheca wickerhamii TaxID=3111 RepID=A0AAD9IMX7_PROWI|nr:hypothetical protein QBZ16_002080 [Prototheca wickerhamii]
MHCPLGTAQCSAVVETKVPQGQSYGFASFATLEEAQAVLDMAAQTPLITPEGVPLRLNWARGSLPEWKRGEARSGGGVPEGAPVLHPRVREAQERAAAVVSTIDESTLAEVNLATPPPPHRPLVSYDDI